MTRRFLTIVVVTLIAVSGAACVPPTDPTPLPETTRSGTLR
jgi:hypothetical protein